MRRNAAKPKESCKSKMIEEVVAVQRLVLLEPAPRPDTSGLKAAPGPVTRSKARASHFATPSSSPATTA